MPTWTGAAAVRYAILSVLAFTITGCATTAGAPAAPDYRPPVGTPAPARAKLYADCLAQASTAGSYDASGDADTQLLRFTCTGAPALAFYDALGPWSVAQRSQWAAEGRTWRSTQRVKRDLFGVDYCSSDAAGDARCVIVLNVGRFLAR